MKTSSKKKNLFLKIALALLVLILVAVLFASLYLNRFITQALNDTFNKSAESDVYELKFENLSVNVFTGNINVHNVVMQPLAKPAKNYPYINSTLKLTTKSLKLEDVSIIALLTSGALRLKKIVIAQPEIELNISSKLPVFFPFKDSTANDKEDNKKKFITAFSLNEFRLTDAAIHVNNTARQREFKINKLNISLLDLFIDQGAGKDIFSNKLIDLSIGESTANLQNGAVRYGSFKEFKLKIDSIRVEKSKDTMIYQFSDFNAGVSSLDIQTADSIFHFTLQSFKVSYKDKSIELNNLLLKPNVSNDEIQSKYKYQHASFEATIGSLLLKQVNFDSLIYHKKIFINEILIDNVSAGIYKDKTKPIDKTRFPGYFGQQLMSVPVGLDIKQVKATNVNLVSTERKPDSSFAKVNIRRGTMVVKNITNQFPDSVLAMNADAYIEDKAHASLSLGFDYLKPQFSLDGHVNSFNLPDINPLLLSYTPAKITKGTVDEISFSGMVYKTNSSGTMRFLYHNLEVDLALKDKAKWINSALGFAANSSVNSANPAVAGEPPRVVKFEVERDMNKGFFNIIIKSILSGFKETMFMSKENRQAHKKTIKEFEEKKDK